MDDVIHPCELHPTGVLLMAVVKKLRLWHNRTVFILIFLTDLKCVCVCVCVARGAMKL